MHPWAEIYSNLMVLHFELHLGYKMCCSEGIQVDCDHLGIFNMLQKLRTQAFSFFAPTSKTAAAVIEPAASGIAAHHSSH